MTPRQTSLAIVGMRKAAAAKAEESYLDPGWGILGSAGALTGQAIAQTAGLHGAEALMARADDDPAFNRKALHGSNVLDRFLQRRGIYTESVNSLANLMLPSWAGSGYMPPALFEQLKSKNPVLAKFLPDKFTSAVLRPSDYRRLGITAHEAGHALQPKALMSPLIHAGGKAAPVLGTLGAMGVNDKEDARNMALGSTLAMAPLLYSEADASIRGSNIMKRLKVPGRLTPFAGMGTYLGAAALPLLSYKAKDMMGGYRQEQKANLFSRNKSSSFLDKLMGRKEKDYTTAALTGGGLGGAFGLGGLLGSKRMHDNAFTRAQTEADTLSHFTDDFIDKQYNSRLDAAKAQFGGGGLKGMLGSMADHTANNQADAFRSELLGQRKGLQALVQGLQGKANRFGKINSSMKVIAPLMALAGAGIGAATEKKTGLFS